MTRRSDLAAPPSLEVPRYREFPHLFWDLAPDAPVDVENDVILARLLVHGRMADLRRTRALTVTASRLPSLAIPEYIRRFWQKFLSETASG